MLVMSLGRTEAWTSWNTVSRSAAVCDADPYIVGTFDPVASVTGANRVLPWPEALKRSGWAVRYAVKKVVPASRTCVCSDRRRAGVGSGTGHVAGSGQPGAVTLRLTLAILPL